MRHSVLQGIWWNWSLDRYFQELISWSQSLHLSIPKKTPLNPFMVTSASRYWQKPSCKVSAWLHWTPASPKSYILTFPHYLFRTISQSYLQCCLLGCSPRLASNKSLAKLVQYFRFKNKIKLKKMYLKSKVEESIKKIMLTIKQKPKNLTCNSHIVHLFSQ